MPENVVFLEPGDERAQKIAKAMGSQTASDILQILAENPQSLTDITDKLAIPMNTAKYHVENLLEAGLISVSRTRYSVKGREVKVYEITNQLLIVAPRHSAMRSLILKYASLFGIFAICSIIIAVLSPIIGGWFPGNELHETSRLAIPEVGAGYSKVANDGIGPSVTQAAESVATSAKGVANAAVTNITPPNATVPLSQVPPGTIESTTAGVSLDPALAFFLGGMLVIVLLLCYEVWVWKRERKEG